MIDLYLQRHPPVAVQYKGICYGAADIELAPGWESSAEAVLAGWANRLPDRIIHSGASRTRAPAEYAGRRWRIPVNCDPRLREVSLGEWELKSWAAIYAETGSTMDRILAEPETFAPPGGETLFALRDRVLAAITDLARQASEADWSSLLIVTHGGPIAAIRGTLAGQSPQDWPGLIPACGEVISLTLPAKQL